MLKIVAQLLILITLNCCLPDSVGASVPGFVKPRTPADRVFVFVHGIYGDALSTWKSSSGQYLWELLDDERGLGTANIYVYGFPSPFFAGGFSIDDAVSHLSARLRDDDIFAHKQVIFVAHSMGGLVTETFLLRHRELAKKTPMIFLFSTPHEGAHISAIAKLISGNPGLETMISGDKNQYLDRLHRDWLVAKDAGDFPTEIRCAYETLDTYGVRIVTRLSATRLCAGDSPPINSNHIDMFKPAGRTSDAVVALRAAIKTIPPPPQTTPPPQSSASQQPRSILYTVTKRNDDLRFIQRYLTDNGSRVVKRDPAPQCTLKEETWRTEMAFAAQSITLTGRRGQRSVCATTRENITEYQCTARVENVDQILTAGFGETPIERLFGLRCLSGRCFACEFVHKNLALDGSWNVEGTKTSMNELDIRIFTTGGYNGDGSMKAFLAALTRIIGDGDNSPFCKAQSHLCLRD